MANLRPLPNRRSFIHPHADSFDRLRIELLVCSLVKPWEGDCANDT